MNFLIWSNEHRGWWAPNSQGYCRHRKDAGRYSFEEACAIVNDANYSPECRDRPNEAMMPDYRYPDDPPHETDALRPTRVALAALDLPAMPESPNVSPTKD